MTRTVLPYYNASQHGVGLEGATNYANILTNNALIPTFLLVIYAASLYVWSKSEYKMGSGIAFISLFCFLTAIIAQTFTLYGQITIFIFFVGILIGIVMWFVED